MAGGILDDNAPIRGLGVSVDAQHVHGCGVDHDRMAVGMLQQHRVLGHRRRKRCVVRESGHGDFRLLCPLALVPPPAHYQFPGRRLGRPGPDPLDDIGKTGGTGQVDAFQGAADGRHVEMGVDKSGIGDIGAQLDDPGIRPCHGQHIPAIAHGGKAPVFHGYGLSHGCRRIHGVDLSNQNLFRCGQSDGGP